MWRAPGHQETITKEGMHMRMPLGHQERLNARRELRTGLASVHTHNNDDIASDERRCQEVGNVRRVLGC